MDGSHQYERDGTIDTPLAAALAARDVMLHGRTALTVVAVGLDGRGRHKESVILSACKTERPPFDRIGFGLWVSVARPRTVIVARTALWWEVAEPDAGDYSLAASAARCAHDEQVELLEVLLVGRAAAVSLRGWFPEFFSPRDCWLFHPTD